MAVNLDPNVRAQRKLLITVAEWVAETGASDDDTVTKKSGDTSDNTKYYREILGTRTEDSSIEFNADISTTTDILGITYTDVNKTEPQQTLDPYYILGGSHLGDYLTTAALANNIDAYNNVFNLYIITAFIYGHDSTSDSKTYYCAKHSGCSVIPTSLGGGSYTALPLEIHFSNNITEGSVDTLAWDFTFTKKS